MGDSKERARDGEQKEDGVTWKGIQRERKGEEWLKDWGRKNGYK